MCLLSAEGCAPAGLTVAAPPRWKVQSVMARSGVAILNAMPLRFPVIEGDSGRLTQARAREHRPLAALSAARSRAGRRPPTSDAAAAPPQPHLPQQKVLHNLVSNSCKFTLRGFVTVGGSFSPDSDSVTIFVEDTGIGARNATPSRPRPPGQFPSRPGRQRARHLRSHPTQSHRQGSSRRPSGASGTASSRRTAARRNDLAGRDSGCLW